MFSKPLLLLSLLMVSVSLLEAVSYCAPSCVVASIGEKVPAPWDCTKYSVCADFHGDGVLWPSEPISCPDGQYFNTLQCEPIAGAPSGFCVTSCSPCEPLCSMGDTTPHPKDCNAFYVCLNSGELVTARCDTSPAEPYYDYLNGGCSADPTVCFNFCDLCVPYCITMGNVADPVDCTSFYYCSPPELTLLHCPVNENFNASAGVCSATSTCITQCI